MLSHLRRRVVETLASVDEAMLSTYGPADLQAAPVAVSYTHLDVYKRQIREGDNIFFREDKCFFKAKNPAPFLIFAATIDRIDHELSLIHI